MLTQGVAGGLRAWAPPGGAAGSAPGRRGEGGGQAEPADQRGQAGFRAAVPPDRGVRACGDCGQRVAQGRSRRPRRAGIAALGGLDDRDEEPGSSAVASCSSWPARERSRRSQPRTVAAGTLSCAPSRAEPVPCSADRAAACAITPMASRAPGRRSARRPQAAAGPHPLPLPASHPDLPLPPVPPRPQPPGPARRAGQRAGRQGRGRGLRIGAQQHRGDPSRSRSSSSRAAARGPGRFVLHPARPDAAPQPGPPPTR